MSGAYYNENDPFAAAWLRELIKADLIAPGEVDERSIEEVKPEDLRGFTQCHFFAGIGGWPIALKYIGWPDDRAIWTGSCPCQDFSLAGKRAGFKGDRDLWPLWFGLIAERRPECLFGEQVDDSPKWYDRTADDLESIGYTCGALIVPAIALGALQERGRLFYGAHTNGLRPQRLRSATEEPWTREQFERLVQAEARLSVPAGKDRALADGVLNRAPKLRGYGNAIVPQAAQAFIEAYMSLSV